MMDEDNNMKIQEQIIGAIEKFGVTLKYKDEENHTPIANSHVKVFQNEL